MSARHESEDTMVFPALRHEVLGALSMPGVGPDRLRLDTVPFVPEVRLHLAEDAVLWWARMEAAAGQALGPPFWASVWPGGQAMARYVLDHPSVVAGRRVLDLGCGSGLVGIAAALAGAATVIANDIDPHAVAAVESNAAANGVEIDMRCGDLLDGDGLGAQVVLAGDVFYNDELANQVLTFLKRVSARGGLALVGDPGRPSLPRDRLALVKSYDVPHLGVFEDAEITQIDVLRLAGPRR